MEVKEGNKLIATFMGAVLTLRNDEDAVFVDPECKLKEYFRVTRFNKYHSSWDELMPVVEKIEDMGFEINICQRSVLIMNDVTEIPEPITIHKLPAEKRFETQVKTVSKINSTWQAVTQFIQFYNQQKK